MLRTLDQYDRCHARPGDIVGEDGYVPFYGALKDPTYVYSSARKARDRRNMLAKRKAYYERVVVKPPKPPDESKRKDWPEPPCVYVHIQTYIDTKLERVSTRIGIVCGKTIVCVYLQM